MKRLLPVLLILTVFLTVLNVTGCGETSNSGNPGNPGNPGKPGITLNLSAAVSLKDTLQEIGTIYEKKVPGLKINFNFASSGTLAQQIEQGAPADLFISAGKKQMDSLTTKGLVETPESVAANELVFVIPKASSARLTGLEQLTSDQYHKIAMGNPETVPAGEYARASLEKTGIFEQLKGKLVYAKDVRQVLTYVETGNVDGGFVYRSDVQKSASVRTDLLVPHNLHGAITYPAAVVKDSANRESAVKFLNFLKTEEAKTVLKKYGFGE